MKMLKIMSIITLTLMTGQVIAMEKYEIKPVSMLEWLFGYRTYTPEEQRFVDFFAELEPKGSFYIDKWFREYYEDVDQRKEIAKEFVEFIKLKSLEKTFPNIYSVAAGIKKMKETDPKDREFLEEAMSGQGKAPSPLSAATIKKGLHPGIDIGEEIEESEAEESEEEDEENI